MSADFNQIFDVVIAGAGPAGCVLANRLSEDSSLKVLLIEAGPDAAMPGAEHPDLLDPFAPVASSDPQFHWPGLMVRMRPDAEDREAGGWRPYLQGFGVGGGSNINGMGVDRGQPGDYDEWRNLGAAGWGWEDVLPHFKKLEHDLDCRGVCASSMHGENGPMPVGRVRRSKWPRFTAAIGEALQRRGFNYIADYNAEFGDGFSAAPTSGLPDRRVSASMAYLTAQVRSRPNLTIAANIKAQRLDLNGRRVTGVHIERAGTITLVRARQTIAACGAIQTPALLMRSGIGPGEQLKNLGIEVVFDSPGVGANLQNHPCISLTTYLAHEAVQAPDNRSFLQNWLRYSSNHPGCESRDMHLMPFNKCAWHKLGGRVGAVTISVLKSYSTGNVELASADPAIEPSVRLNLLADLRDEVRLADGLHFGLTLLSDPNVARLRREIFLPNIALAASLSQRNVRNGVKARAIAMVLDQPLMRRMLLARLCVDTALLMTDSSARCDFVRRNVQPQYHVCGTCRMGRADDPQAVVDSTGRVYGIEGLRIGDASIFPTVPRGYPHFIVIMAAEKMARHYINDERRYAFGFAGVAR